MSVLDSLFGAKKFDEPCVMGDESIMSKKKHGTSEVPAQKDLRWNCDYDTADRVSFVLFVYNENSCAYVFSIALYAYNNIFLTVTPSIIFKNCKIILYGFIHMIHILLVGWRSRDDLLLHTYAHTHK